MTVFRMRVRHSGPLYRPLPLVLLLCLFFPPVFASAQRGKDQGAEESQDYYRKWLSEDVVFIITQEEKDVFRKLTTNQERDRFIEQFWLRRDTDPATALNEFKEEHYRRIAYANEHFQSWLSDRGRIYILHGEPTEIIRNPTGGYHRRNEWEGGGTTSTFPFETWRYQYIEGVGTDIVLEFVDASMSGEYRLAKNPEEKDALINLPGAGQTIDEREGYASLADRNPLSPFNKGSMLRDRPFERYLEWVKVQAPKPVKYQDLKQFINIRLSYQELPVQFEADYYRLSDNLVLVPLTVQIPNQQLNFRLEHGVHLAKVAIYGLVTTLGQRVVSEFEDDLEVTFDEETFSEGVTGSSLLQKVVMLEPGTAHKVTLVVKDLNSESAGVVQKALTPPVFDRAELVTTAPVVSDLVYELDQVPTRDMPFVLGDLRVRPRPDRRFPVGTQLTTYFQLYNGQLDQMSLKPQLEIQFEIFNDKEESIAAVTDKSGQSIQFFSSDRIVVTQPLPLLTGGNYRLEVRVKDQVSGKTSSTSSRFTVTS